MIVALFTQRLRKIATIKTLLYKAYVYSHWKLQRHHNTTPPLMLTEVQQARIERAVWKGLVCVFVHYSHVVSWFVIGSPASSPYMA